MGRTRRQGHAGLFHVTCRSIAGEHVFKTTDDFLDGIQILDWLVARRLLRCHDFCLMPTHYHLFASFEEGLLTTAIHHLNRRYAVNFNHRHARRGHVFDSPYRSIEVTDERHLLVLPAYFAHNPPNLTWPWNAYGGTVGMRQPFGFVDPTPLVETFGSVARLRAFVEAWQPTERDLNLVHEVRLRQGTPRASRASTHEPGSRACAA